MTGWEADERLGDKAVMSNLNSGCLEQHSLEKVNGGRCGGRLRWESIGASKSKGFGFPLFWLWTERGVLHTGSLISRLSGARAIILVG